jgi:hypothetical protein
MLTELSLENQIAEYKKVFVKNTLWPKNKLNVMYLSLFGSDW